MEMCYCECCLESCYWNLIEEKFCFDESIALYEEPVKKSNEKNNNLFDNMAFYDSVSVIAGRAIVTIDPLDSHKQKSKELTPVIEQPRKRLKWPEKNSKDLESDYLRQKLNVIENEEKQPSRTDTDGESDVTLTKQLIPKKFPLKLNEKFPIKKSVSFHNIPDKTSSSGDESDYYKPKNFIVPEEEEVQMRGSKSLRERRMSKSLSLRIGVDIPKELPIIRQNSMPKFYLDTPDENQLKDSTLVKNSALVMVGPPSNAFNFDLQSVVQMEKDRQCSQAKHPPVPIHRETSKLNLIKDKILLKKSKSTVSASNLPHTNHM